MKSFLVVGLCGALLLFAPGCAGQRSPQAVAANIAHNGTLLVNAVDAVQKFIIAQEAAGRIPRNQAVTVMEGIGRGLTASKQAAGYLNKLAELPSGSEESRTVIEQLQDVLALVTSEVAQTLVPIGDEAIRKQVAALIVEISKIIGTINSLVLGGVK